uniref:Pyroglutamylated RFamide peptide n=1 Tax=Sphenodon punctatus TaxID=8508 RepID=A0A8D0HCC6_SPHPU
MKASYSLSYLLLMTLGACFPPNDRQDPGGLGEGMLLENSWQAAAEDDQPGLWLAVPKLRRSEGLNSLFSMAKELQSFSKERAGLRFRFGRQEESQEEEGEVINFLPGEGEKRSSATLGNLAEELSGYNRKKGGFSFRFGRR